MSLPCKKLGQRQLASRPEEEKPVEKALAFPLSTRASSLAGACQVASADDFLGLSRLRRGRRLRPDSRPMLAPGKAGPPRTWGFRLYALLAHRDLPGGRQRPNRKTARAGAEIHLHFLLVEYEGLRVSIVGQFGVPLSCNCVVAPFLIRQTQRAVPTWMAMASGLLEPTLSLRSISSHRQQMRPRFRHSTERASSEQVFAPSFDGRKASDSRNRRITTERFSRGAGDLKPEGPPEVRWTRAIVMGLKRPSQ